MLLSLLSQARQTDTLWTHHHQKQEAERVTEGNEQIKSVTR
jgi:hypothetical protein